MTPAGTPARVSRKRLPPLDAHKHADSVPFECPAALLEAIASPSVPLAKLTVGSVPHLRRADQVYYFFDAPWLRDEL